jgi:hypothetical protein
LFTENIRKNAETCWRNEDCQLRVNSETANVTLVSGFLGKNYYKLYSIPQKRWVLEKLRFSFRTLQAKIYQKQPHLLEGTLKISPLLDEHSTLYREPKSLNE